MSDKLDLLTAKLNLKYIRLKYGWIIKIIEIIIKVAKWLKR